MRTRQLAEQRHPDCAPPSRERRELRASGNPSPGAGHIACTHSPGMTVDHVAERKNDVLGGNFVLGEELGHGGMASVYSAVQLSLGRTVAIKVPHPELAHDLEVRRRFRSEAIAGGQLTHRNIVKVIDLLETRDAMFLVMERVRGRPLSEMQRATGPLDPRTAVDLACQVLSALEEAHAAGIVHADVKCENVLVGSLREGGTVVQLIDFGLAHFQHVDVDDGPRVVYGTPAYMAPELIRGDLPTRVSDLYAVGVMLYSLVTGVLPFPGRTFHEVLFRQLHDPVQAPSTRLTTTAITPRLDAAIVRALARQPAERFPDAASFAQELRSAITSRPRTAASTSPMSPATDTARVNSERERVSGAVATGTPGELASAVHDLARALIDEHRHAEAAMVLEDGLAALAAAPPPATLWCLHLTLTLVHIHLGDHVRALRAARACHQLASEARDPVGELRARELLVRLLRSNVALVDRARPHVIEQGSSR